MERAALITIALLAAASPAPAQRSRTTATPATALERIRQSGRITFGYRVDARPFAFRDASGNPDGYAVALCRRVAEAVRTELGLSSITEEWVPVTLADRFAAVQGGQVDLLCGSETETMARRAEVSFSIPTYPGGVGAMLRRDAPARLRDVLSGKRSTNPTWRASAGRVLGAQTVSFVPGTTAEPWVAAKMNEFHLTTTVDQVADYDAGIQGVLDRRANVFFADRAILLDALKRHPSNSRLMVMDRWFTYESNALVMARGDDAFRLVVDRALSRLYAASDFPTLYRQWFGEPGDEALTFFRWNARPE